MDEIEGIEALKNLAMLMWTYYEALLEAGFTPEQAMELVKVRFA